MTEQPNVVLIVMDDMRHTDWQALPRTQERLAEGTFFPNNFSPTPICGPSRTCLLTGQYARTSGIRTNNRDWDTWRDTQLAHRTIATSLKQAGYRTGLFGKFLNWYGIPKSSDKTTAPVPTGWDAWFALNLYQGNTYNFTDFTAIKNGNLRRFENTYSTDVLRQKAVSFIANTPAAQPLFLYFTPTAPHTPATPANRHRGLYAGAQVERTPSFTEDVSDKPAFIRQHQRKGALTLDALERDRLETLAAVDGAIIDLVDELAATDRLANTVIFITSDNGYQMGHHNWDIKQVPYDLSARCPLLVWGGPFTAGDDPRLVAHIDVAPTIAELAGVPFPTADGVSLLSGSRDAVLIDQRGGAVHYDAIRTDRYLYVEHQTGERELFDYQTDPYELQNQLATWLVEPPTANPAVVADLAARLDELRIP